MPQKPKREKEPFIKQGDEIFITRGGGGAVGAWKVAAVRWRDSTSDKIEMVLRRGSTGFKTLFNRETMQVRSNRPAHKLVRPLNLPKTARFGKKAA